MKARTILHCTFAGQGIAVVKRHGDIKLKTITLRIK